MDAILLTRQTAKPDIDSKRSAGETAGPPRSEGRMISTWLSWPQEEQVKRNFLVASVNSISAG
jgi:hypothetical protein